MYPNGGLVTLSVDKAHGEGEDAVKLKSGVCGMITHCKREKGGNHLYTVDFGAYGGWYCHHNELDGDDKEGWDGDQEVQEEMVTINWQDIPQRPPRVVEDTLHIDGQDELNDILDGGIESDDLIADESLTEEERQDAGFVKIDLEADMKKRMAAIERGEE
jgi:hypothetical protein